MSLRQERERLRKNPLGRAFLWLLSMIYGAAVLLRRLSYRWGLLRSKSLPAKVVCIGNITAGGTGKTPAVLLAARTLLAGDQSVAILSRGYGRSKKNGGVTVLMGDRSPSWTECGDEPWMMHQALKERGVPIFVCSDRAKAGEKAVEFHHSKILILDDGFQHFGLERDLDIVLLNAKDPFGGGRLLPLGDLREPVSALSRAQLVLLTHVDQVDGPALDKIKAQVHAANPRAPILESVHAPEFLLDVKAEKKFPVSMLKGIKVVAFSGLGDPSAFESHLSGLGAEVAQKWRYPDHHPYRLRELKSIEQLRQGMPVVTTFKDLARLPLGWKKQFAGDVYALGIRLEIRKGREIWNETLTRLAGTP